MFLTSFVLEDWALDELINLDDLANKTRQRRTALLLVASSYVTWTFQTHTFSNSVETLTVLWSLVLIKRITAPHVSLLLLHYVYLCCQSHANAP